MNAGRAGMVIRWLVAGGLAAIVLSFFFDRGLAELDEGDFFDTGARIVHGEVLYRDILMAQPPGHYYLCAGLIRLFGPCLFPWRIVWIGVGVLMAIALAEVVARGLPPVLAGLAGGCTVAITMPNLTFLSYYWTANLVAVWALVALLRSHAGHPARRLRIAGALGTVSFLLKQNTGGYAAVGLILAALVLPTPDGAGCVKRLFRLATGAMAALALAHVAFVVAGLPMAALWMSTLGLFRLGASGIFDVPMPAPWAILPASLTLDGIGDALRSAMFYVPLVSVGITLLRDGRKTPSRDPLALAAGLFALLMLLHLAPRAKWPYMSKASLVPLPLLFLSAWKAARGRSWFVGAAWTLAIATVLGVSAQREIEFHNGENVPMDGPFEGIKVTREVHDHLVALRGVVQPLLGPSDTILALPTAAILYPYFGRPCEFHAHFIIADAVVMSTELADLERTKPRVVLLGPAEGFGLAFFTDARTLVARVHETYHRRTIIDGTEVWVRRD